MATPLAVINVNTHVVENLIVPPEGSQLWFAPEGYTAVPTDVGQIGWTYDGGVFNPPAEA